MTPPTWAERPMRGFVMRWTNAPTTRPRKKRRMPCQKRRRRRSTSPLVAQVRAQRGTARASVLAGAGALRGIRRRGLPPARRACAGRRVLAPVGGWRGAGRGGADAGGVHPSELGGSSGGGGGRRAGAGGRPPFLLWDEPFGALDPITRAELQREFRALQARLRKTAIFVTHDMREAALVGDRIAVVAGGRLRAVATPEALRESRDPEVRALVDA